MLRVVLLPLRSQRKSLVKISGDAGLATVGVTSFQATMNSSAQIRAETTIAFLTPRKKLMDVPPHRVLQLPRFELPSLMPEHP